MSLLDDVSIVVTPNGYKAGELYAVVPVPTESAELVTNGDFATDSDWTKGTGVTIGSNVATFTSTPSGQSVSQNAVATALPNGSLAKVSFEVLSRTEGSFGLYFSGTLVGSKSSVGVFTAYFTKGTETSFYIRALGTTSGTISNVSVIQETKADMDVTRATAATRVDENGLVNYAEIIGGEEVTCGDFECAVPTDSWNTIGDSTITSTGNIISTSGSVSGISQTNILEIGKNYKLIYTISNYVSGGLKVAGTQIPSNLGSNNYYFTASATSLEILRNSGITNISISNGGCPHILAEPQRTNLVTYSSDFSNAVWGNASIGTTPVLTSGFTSPDGTDNAYKISNANQDSFLYISGITASTDSRSIYARTVSGTGTAQLLSHNSNTNNTFNLTEEWQRFEVSSTTSATGPTSYYAVDFRGSGTLTELLIWGAQTEVGSYPTSYIPTNGEAGGVTRNQDIFTRDGIGSLINSEEGVLFVEMAALSDDLSARRISINDGSYNNIVEIGYTSGTNEIKNRVKSGGGTQANMNYTATDILSDLKIALKWKVNDFAVWVNGVEVATDTSGTAPIGLSQISFDRGDGTQNFFGKVKQLQVYDTALGGSPYDATLSDTRLAALTS
jgi:hypothetical protein